MFRLGLLRVIRIGLAWALRSKAMSLWLAKGWMRFAVVQVGEISSAAISDGKSFPTVVTVYGYQLATGGYARVGVVKL